MLHNGLQVGSSETQMTLDFSKLKNIFPLHTKMQNYHFKYPDVLNQLS